MVGASVAGIFFNSGNADISVASPGWFISDKTAVGASLIINPNGQKLLMSKMAVLTGVINSRAIKLALAAFSGIISG